MSQVMSSVYGVSVLAVDSQDSNTQGAVVREQRLRSRWSGLSVRANERAGGEAVTNRKTRIKTKETATIKDTPNNEAEFVTLTKYVEEGSDIGDLVDDHLPQCSDRIGIIGLHTCGDLATHSLNSFLSSPRVHFLCNVGCCYNHLSHQGFPLSQHLKSQNYQLQRSVKMLGVQPLDRLGQEAKLPNQSLLWRAVMEVIFNDLNIDTDNRGVGRIASKCKDFVQYVRKCEKKLCISVDMSDNALLSLHQDMSDKYWRQLTCFYQYKALFSLLIESIILTDRLLYLREQNIENCSIIKLFDSYISPRCYAVIAMK